jgi:hypothetical protein
MDRPEETGEGGWSSSTEYTGGPGADPTSIRFVKSKEFTSCQLHEVDYASHRGLSMNVLFKTWRDAGEWRVHPCGGGAGPHPHRNQPWVNMTAGFGADGFTGGGHVVGDGAVEVAAVRLRFAGGITIEDTVDHGVVLFFDPRTAVMPVEVDMLSASGEVLRTYQELTDLADP